ncbi:Slam-dependent surface lipoprotein [Sphingobium sp. Z007]|uniref:Slam-dependent surface lipoprotein n=1 Tax=Sphingobium sp. Z007 TaxID=627495 RepID=UPI00159553AF|nr:Slam-dependent surface lipoprotein [Sphingobium sp. Z007]
MKFVHLKAVVGAMALSIALAGTAQAQIALSDITYATSDDTNVDIGVSNVPFGPHTSGKVGITVPSLNGLFFVDFEGLQNASPPVVVNAGEPGVTTVNNPTGTVTDHSQYGRFDLTKVDGQNVYYGEWSQTGSASAGDHTVYYAGTGGTLAANVPTSGTATYSVQGLSNFASNSQLNGSFNANFGAGTLTGSISSANYALNIGTANISGSGFSGAGATASNPSTSTTLATGGNVSGSFFGSAAQALAGVATFSNRQYDAAFGGSQ